MQESPSGMASASQADSGGFDSRFLLQKRDKAYWPYLFFNGLKRESREEAFARANGLHPKKPDDMQERCKLNSPAGCSPERAVVFQARRHKNLPVRLSGQALTSSGVPQTTSLPPASPPSGPMSTM